MPKILVIEDAHPLRNDIIELLSFEGYEVRGAENGLVGVEIARQYQPDLIVCDIMMPELDGYGVLDELRKDAHTAAIPFIFLTAKTDKTDIRHGMGLGADDYLTKPFMTPDLLNTIRVRLERRKMLAEQAERRLKELRESILTALPHELRTPLNTIIGFSEMFVAESHQLKPDQINEWGRHIHTAGLRLYHLLENYLTYVRVAMMLRDTDKRAALKMSHTSHPDSIIEFRAVHKAQQQQRDTDLALHIVPVETIQIAEQDLIKIVDELVDNAFKFSERGSPVEVETALNSDSYLLRITDHGYGMLPEQITAVGAYMQFDRWLYEQQGMGLGLIIAKQLAEMYGGSLNIVSVPKDYTTVTVRLPLAAVQVSN